MTKRLIQMNKTLSNACDTVKLYGGDIEYAEWDGTFAVVRRGNNQINLTRCDFEFVEPNQETTMTKRLIQMTKDATNIANTITFHNGDIVAVEVLDRGAVYRRGNNTIYFAKHEFEFIEPTSPTPESRIAELTTANEKLKWSVAELRSLIRMISPKVADAFQAFSDTLDEVKS